MKQGIFVCLRSNISRPGVYRNGCRICFLNHIKKPEKPLRLPKTARKAINQIPTNVTKEWLENHFKKIAESRDHTFISLDDSLKIRECKVILKCNKHGDVWTSKGEYYQRKPRSPVGSNACPTCYSLWKSETTPFKGLKGEKNPNWKGGVEPLDRRENTRHNLCPFLSQIEISYALAFLFVCYLRYANHFCLR